MKEINKQHDQLSGYIDLIAVPINNIKIIQGSDIEFYSYNSNYKFNCSNETISYTYYKEYSSSGQSINHIVTALISGQDYFIDKIFKEMDDYRFLIILRRADGKYVRIGDLNRGLSFYVEFNSPSDPNGSINYQVNFKGTSLQPPTNCIFKNIL